MLKNKMIVTTSTNIFYVETNEEVVKCSFRSLEFVNATFVRERSKVSVPRLSKNFLIKVSEILRRGNQVDKGLGKYHKGRTKASK